MKTAEQSQASPEPQRFRSLLSKVFLPFSVLIISLFIIALLGAFHIAEKSFKNSTDQRLVAAQETLYREFKKQEIILQTYSVIMQQFQSLSERFQGDSELAILRDKLFRTLEEENISTAFYPADISGMIPQESMVLLFDQVRRSGKSRFRYNSDFGNVPVLMVASPLFSENKVAQILLLKASMGNEFLNNMATPLDVSASLLTVDGRVMARSKEDLTDVVLTPAQINLLGTGQKLFIDRSSSNGPERQMLSHIPLGSSDMVLLSLHASLKESTEIQRTTILQIVLIMLAIILTGTVFYFRRISNITRPARELKNATEALCRGNMNYRIHDITNDELGSIALSFNQMASELESSYHKRADQDISIAVAKEADRIRPVLEGKERELDALNQELSLIQRQTTALYQLNQAMTASIEINVLFDRILQVLNETLLCDHIVLLMHNPGESILEVVRTSGLDADALRNVQFSFEQGITGEAAQSQKLIYVTNMEGDDRNLSYHGQLVSRGSMISAPLIVKDRLVGAINLHKRQKDAFSDSERKLVQAVANQTAIAIDNAHLLERSRDLSNTDELTGLSNRRYFQEILKREVAQARRFSTVFSVLMCDIDDFSHHKSELGNVRASALLRQVGQVLLKNTRGIDLVSRFSNDQFIILLPKTSKKGGVSAAEKLRNCIINKDFAELIDVDKAFKVTVSFGVTEFPVDSKNIYELLNLADRALYASKQEGGNCTVAWEGPAPAPD
jgi:diguanylate cyclase (GGDEF)-like protein